MKKAQKKTVSFSMDMELYEKLRAYALSQGRHPSQQVRYEVRQALKRQEDAAAFAMPKE